MKKKSRIVIATLLIFTIGIGTMIMIHQDKSPTPHPLSFNTIMDKNKDINFKDESKLQGENVSKTPVNVLTSDFTNAIQNMIKHFSGKEIKIVAIGDSLTQGVGDETGQGGYVGILDQYLNHKKHVATFINYGKRGNRTDHLLKRINEPNIKADLKDADIIIITIGANDIMKVVKENFVDITYQLFTKERVDYEKRLRGIFSNLTALNTNASIYLIGFYNPFQQYFDYIEELDMIVDDWNHTSQTIAEDYGATFIPTKDLFTNTEVNLFAEDHFHPNHNGYQLIAERILNYLVIE